MIRANRIPSSCMGTLALGWMASVLAAPAASIVHTYTDQHVGVLLTASGPQEVVDLPFNYSQAIPQFNPALGTLTSIIFDMSFDFRASGDSGASGGNLGGGIGGTTYMGGYSFTGMGGGWGQGDSAGNLLVADFNVSELQALTVGVLGNPAIFTSSTGTGTVLWEYASNESFGLDFYTTGTATGQLAIVADSLEVTYVYDAIPEPSCASLLGLAGLGLLIRRRP